MEDIWGNTNAVSDQALSVKGFYVDLEQRGIKFASKDKRSIQLALNWANRPRQFGFGQFQDPRPPGELKSCAAEMTTPSF